MALFEPGKQIEYNENTIIYIDDKEGEDTIKGVQLYLLRNGSELAQEISAASGVLSVDKTEQKLLVRLYDCMVVSYTGAETGTSAKPAAPFPETISTRMDRPGSIPRSLNSVSTTGCRPTRR